MIDPLAFIPPAELPPDAATETTLAAISGTLGNPIAVTGELTLDDSTPLAIDKVGLATTAGQATIAQAILDSEPDVSPLAKESTLGQVNNKLGGVLSFDKSGLATASGLADILAQLQGDRAIASQVFTDSTGTVYLKALAFNATTNTYESTTLTLAGAPYTPTPPETPISASDLDTVELTWEIITAGTGYAVGNFVSQYNFIRQGPPPAIVATLWVNEGTTIAAPPASHRRKVGSSGATEGTLSQLKASLELQAKLTDSQPVDLRIAGGAIATGSGASNAQTLRVATATDSPLNTLTGQLNDAAPASDIAPSSLNGRLQRIAQNLTSLTSMFKVAGQFLAQSIGIALPRKETITGTATTTAAANANLLSGTAIATDVRDYNSAELTIISTATTGSYTIQCCHDAAFTTGVTTLQAFESTVQAANPINAAVTPTASTRRFGLNLTGINYIRVNLTTGAVGVQAIAVLSQMAFVPNQTNVQQAVGASLQTAVSTLPTLGTVTTVNTVAASQSAAQSAAVVDVASAAITATATTSAFTPTWGVSQIFSVVVSALSGTAPTLDVVVQESPDGGTTWVPVHTFAQITAIGTYNSPLIAQAGRAYRYVQTIGGTTPSFTRTINRYASNVAILPSFSDIFRLRANAPRKPAAVTLTATAVVDLIPAPSNPAHRHVICWICGQNATDTPTIAEFTGGLVPIKVVAAGRGSGRDFSVDQQIMTLPAGAAFRVGQSVATTFEASCGYYTIDAAGAPV